MEKEVYGGVICFIFYSLIFLYNFKLTLLSSLIVRLTWLDPSEQFVVKKFSDQLACSGFIDLVLDKRGAIGKIWKDIGRERIF